MGCTLHLHSPLFSAHVKVLVNCLSLKLLGSEKHREQHVSPLFFELGQLLLAVISEGNCKSPTPGDAERQASNCRTGRKHALLGAENGINAITKKAAVKRRRIVCTHVLKGRKSSNRLESSDMSQVATARGQGETPSGPASLAAFRPHHLFNPPAPRQVRTQKSVEFLGFHHCKVHHNTKK